jgi:hypothetical protein
MSVGAMLSCNFSLTKEQITARQDSSATTAGIPSPVKLWCLDVHRHLRHLCVLKVWTPVYSPQLVRPEEQMPPYLFLPADR